MFNLTIDSKLRGCDLVRVRIDDVYAGRRVRDRATVIQKKTGRPVQFEITQQTRSAIGEWLAAFHVRRDRCLHLPPRKATNLRGRPLPKIRSPRPCDLSDETPNAVKTF